MQRIANQLRLKKLFFQRRRFHRELIIIHLVSVFFSVSLKLIDSMIIALIVY
jgi:preprotein translocase subunit SecE